jgi:CDP-2,3-bis-(O-geranylgeranyl)-sn-glycerol synthase
MDVILLIFQALYLLVPAYAANMSPVIFRGSFKFLAYPIDCNLKLNGKPIFGKNKTFRGLIFAIIAGMVLGYIQFLLRDIPMFQIISILDYSWWPIIGFLLGFGAISGDLIESFFKRRVGIGPGKPWIPFDQIDFVVMALLFLLIHHNPGLGIWIIGIALTFVLDIIVNHLAFYFRIRNEKW